MPIGILHLLLKIFQVVEKGVEEEVTGKPEDGASAKQAHEEHTPANQIVEGLSQERGPNFSGVCEGHRLGSFELKVDFEKCMSQQCHNTIAALFMSQCLFLTVCREWFNTHLTTTDQPGIL